MRIPDGAEFNNPAEDNRFSSVFVLHKKSRTLHNDNTLMYYDPEHLNCCLRLCGVNSRRIFFHPNLTTGGLHRFPEAVRFFKDWMRRLIDDWDFVNICTAHNGVLMHDGKKMLKLSLKRYEQKFLELSRIKSSRFQQSGRRSFSLTSSKGDKRSSLPGNFMILFRIIVLFYFIHLHPLVRDISLLQGWYFYLLYFFGKYFCRFVSIIFFINDHNNSHFIIAITVEPLGAAFRSPKNPATVYLSPT